MLRKPRNLLVLTDLTHYFQDFSEFRRYAVDALPGSAYSTLINAANVAANMVGLASQRNMTMTTQTNVDARTARELASSLDLDCTVTTDGDEIVIDFGGGAEESFSTLEDAVAVVERGANANAPMKPATRPSTSVESACMFPLPEREALFAFVELVGEERFDLAERFFGLRALGLDFDFRADAGAEHLEAGGRDEETRDEACHLH